jgi:hypothetical protein
MLLLLQPVFVVYADRGMIPVISEVSVYEPGQKAIIAWNGIEEILILSTDVLSTSNTAILEILPLPSIPKKIEKASVESFNVIQNLIWYYMPISPPLRYGNETDEVKIVFNEEIGMHDITVVEASNVSAFVEWINMFLLENGISQEVSLQNFELVIEDYMSRGFQFYVLDLVELFSEQRSVEPILYEFDTIFLYYPLLITSPVGGEGKIILFLLTNGIVESGYDPFNKAHYYSSTTVEPIQFRLSNKELSAIDPNIGRLFGGEALMTVLVYEGSLSMLTKDITITKITQVARTDLNLDGKSDIVDFIIVAKAFGSHPEHPRWNPIADVNKDKKVNIVDLYFMAKISPPVRALGL